MKTIYNSSTNLKQPEDASAEEWAALISRHLANERALTDRLELLAKENTKSVRNLEKKLLKLHGKDYTTFEKKTQDLVLKYRKKITKQPKNNLKLNELDLLRQTLRKDALKLAKKSGIDTDQLLNTYKQVIHKMHGVHLKLLPFIRPAFPISFKVWEELLLNNRRFKAPYGPFLNTDTTSFGVIVYGDSESNDAEFDHDSGGIHLKSYIDHTEFPFGVPGSPSFRPDESLYLLGIWSVTTRMPFRGRVTPHLKVIVNEDAHTLHYDDLLGYSTGEYEQSVGIWSRVTGALTEPFGSPSGPAPNLDMTEMASLTFDGDAQIQDAGIGSPVVHLIEPGTTQTYSMEKSQEFEEGELVWIEFGNYVRHARHTYNYDIHSAIRFNASIPEIRLSFERV